MASSLESLPPELLDRVLRATGLSAAQAARVFPYVCRAFRASSARVAASAAPLATVLALACGDARAVLLLRLRLLPPTDTPPAEAPRAVTLPPEELLARYDVPGLRTDLPAGRAWTTYVARYGARGGEVTPLLVCEYMRGGLVRASLQRHAKSRGLTRRCRAAAAAERDASDRRPRAPGVQWRHHPPAGA